MKRAFLLTLCMVLLVEVCALHKKTSSSSSSSRSSSSSSSSSRSSSSSSSSSSRPKSTGSVKNTHRHGTGNTWGDRWRGGTHNRNHKVLHKQDIPGNNKIMSPRHGDGYAYGNYGQSYGRSGPSPFATYVQNKGYQPSVMSKDFGKQGAVAVGAGAMAGMALGYGLGSYPRHPHVQFHNPQEEYYYNHYMYQHYGSQESSNKKKHTQTHGKGSTDSWGHQGVSDSSSSSSSSSSDSNSFDDGSRPPVRLEPPPRSYDNFMTTCMNRTDLLQSEQTGSQTKPQNKTNAGEPSTTAMPNLSAEPSQEAKNKRGQENKTEEKEAEENEVRDEVVDILEIGYPALIKQLKAHKCVERYIAYTQQWQGAYGHGAKPEGLDFIISSLLCLIGTLLLY